MENQEKITALKNLKNQGVKFVAWYAVANVMEGIANGYYGNTVEEATEEMDFDAKYDFCESVESYLKDLETQY